MAKFIFYAFLGLGLIFAYVKYLEMRSVFFPEKGIEFSPDDINLAFDDIYIKTRDGLTLNGWFIPCASAKYTLIFLHGNAGNLSHRLDKIKIFNKIGLNIFIIDYRGYGKSQGKPQQAGIYTDAQATYSYLRNQRNISPQNIVVYGESLGTAVAIDLVSRAEVKALILEGAFSSGRDMARRIFPLIPSFLFTDSFNSLEKIKRIGVPKLFLHSANDEIVPLGLAKKLFHYAAEPKYFFELSGSHNTAFFDSQDRCLPEITSFVNRL